MTDDDAIEFVGGALDGVWREVGPWAYDYLVPVPIFERLFELDDNFTPIVEHRRVHRYERQIYGNRITGRRIAKMVFVGEEWR